MIMPCRRARIRFREYRVSTNWSTSIFAALCIASVTPQAAFSAATPTTHPVQRMLVEGSTASPAARTHATQSIRSRPAALTIGQLNDHPSKIDQGALEEVVVTAQKYKQPEFDVPMSLAVITGASLQQRHINDIGGLQFAVPGLSVEGTGPNRRINIQGVSNTWGNGGLVGEYIDDAAVSISPSLVSETLDLRTFDLKRVEVLRGPQGTLYGEGSIGGTIRYITTPPDLSSFDFLGTALETFTQGGAPSQLIQTAINAPIVRGTLGIRVAAEFEHDGGWVSQPAADRQHINSSDLTDVRVEALWSPTATVHVNLMQILYQNTYGPNQGSSPDDTFTQPFGLTLTPRVDTRYSVTNATVRLNFDSSTLVSSTTYFHNSARWHDISSKFQDGLLPVGPVYYDFLPYSPSDEGDVSEELRLSSAAQAQWRWTVGGFGKRYSDEILPYAYYLGLAGPLPPQFISAGERVHSRSWSTFADTSYDLLDHVTLGIGVRYFHDKQTFVSGGTQVGTFNSIDPRFYARYKITNSVSAYFNVAKGFRSGGFNTLGFPSYKPESLWSYQLGTKMRLLDRTLSLDADIFFSDYKNYVTLGYTVTNPADIYRNSGVAHIKGVEAKLGWQVSPAWTISLDGDYTSARFAQINLLNADYMVGDPLDAVPRYQATASARRVFFWKNRQSYFRIDYTQRAPESYRLLSIGPWYYSQSDYVYLLDLTIGTKWNENLGFDVFVRNILNDRAYVDPYVIEDTASRTQPRNVGIEFRALFD